MGEQEIVDLKLSLSLRDMVDCHGDLTIDTFPQTLLAAADRLDAQEARIAELEVDRDPLGIRVAELERANKRIVELERTVNARDLWLCEKDAAMTRRDAVIARRDGRIAELEEALRGLQGAADKLLTAMTFAKEEDLPFGSFAEQCAKTETALATVRNLIGKPAP